MSYAYKINGMVGQHLATWQQEQTLTRQMRGLRIAQLMPLGYPPRIYRPARPVSAIPRQVPRMHSGHLSNGVPWTLGLDFAGQYPLGAYNPREKAAPGST